MPRYTVTDPSTNKSVDLEGDSPPSEQELNQIFSQVHGSAEPNQSASSGMMDQISNAVGLSPLGMVAKGANAIGQGFNQALDKTALPVPDSVQGGAKSLFGGARAVGVGLARNATGQSPTDVTRGVVGSYTGNQAPQNAYGSAIDKAGATLGENIPVAAAGMVSPTIAGPLAIMAQQAQSGKVSPLPLLPAAAKGASKLFSGSGLADKVIPPLLKSMKGIPLNATKMAIADPSIMDLPGTSESIQGKSQAIIDAIKEAHRKVGDQFGQAYAEQGMKSPVEQIINGDTPYKSQLGNHPYEVPGEPIQKQQQIPGYSYQAPGASQHTGINPLEVTGENPGQSVNVPGRSYTYMEDGPNKTVSSQEVKSTAPSQYQPKGFDELRNDYHNAISGDLFKQKGTAGGYSEMPTVEKLSALTDLKRNLQNQAVYPAPGQQLSPSQGAQNAAIKQMASSIDKLRGTLPGGDKLALADDAWSEMSELKHRLMSAFKDPYTGQDYLNRILKGNTDWLTSGRMAGKVGAIERIEQLTGKQVLQPALKEMAAAYMKNPDVMSLPSHGLKSIITALIPNKLFIKTGAGTIADTVPQIRRMQGAGTGQSQDSKGPTPYPFQVYGENNQQSNPTPMPRKLFRKAS